jgi:MoxR-like ATPase
VNATSIEQLSSDALAVRTAVTAARGHLVDRELIAEVVALSAVAREHVLVIGAPGTAKSAAVRRTAEHLGGRYFEYLLGRFTEPNEIFGPVDLRQLRDGVVAFQTGGMLPDAEIAFLDEVFLGSSAILNTLLGLLNERVFRRGATVAACPIRVCVGASNALPTDPALAAFADRFLARVHVQPVADGSLEDLLEQGWTGRPQRSGRI